MNVVKCFCWMFFYEFGEHHVFLVWRIVSGSVVLYTSASANDHFWFSIIRGFISDTKRFNGK